MVDWQLTSCLRTDKLFELRKDYKRLEIPRAIGVPYDLLEACNPESALQNLSCGTVISIGTSLGAVIGVGHARSMCSCRKPLHSTRRGHLGFYCSTAQPAWAQSELIKYNYNLDPEYIRPGQVLAVPTVRGERQSSLCFFPGCRL